MTPAARSFSTEQTASLPPAVAEIGKIHFEGNIIPHQWYQHIICESGKPDLPAIIILAEIIYWYRPYQTLTKGGRSILHKRFEGDRFQCTAAYFVDKFGLTKDQTRKALKRLEDAGYIHREYRDILHQGILHNCITFVEPIPLAIMEITHPSIGPELIPIEAAPPSPVGDPPSPVGVVYKGIKIPSIIMNYFAFNLCFFLRQKSLVLRLITARIQINLLTSLRLAVGFPDQGWLAFTLHD